MLNYSCHLPVAKRDCLILFTGITVGLVFLATSTQHILCIYCVIAISVVFLKNPFYGTMIFLFLRSSLDIFSLWNVRFLGITPAAGLGILLILLSTSYILLFKAGINNAKPVAIPFLSFVVWISISVIKSPVPFEAFYGWAKTAADFLIFLTIANTICKQTQVKKIIVVVLTASAIPCIVGIYQLIIRDPGLQHVAEVWGAERAFYRIRGTLAHTMTFGDFLGLMIVFYSILLIELYHRLSYRLLAVLIGALACWGVLLINTYTRSSWIAVVIGISLFSIVTKRYRLLLAFGGLVLLIGLLFPNVVVQRFQDVLHPSEYGGNTLIDRLALWKLALMNAGENIVTGKGSGAFLETSRMELGQTEAVHNIYIQTLFELGIVGLLLLVWLQLSIIKCAVRNYRKIKSVTYRAVSLAFLMAYVAFGVITPLMANRLSSPSISWYMFALCGMVTCLPAMEERCLPSAKMAQVGTPD